MRNAHVNYELPLVEVPVWTLKTAEPFCNLFPIRPTVLSQIIDDMNKNGYDACQPIVVWNMTVVDGHTRLRAAIAAGIETVPVICRRFAGEDEALEYAIKTQRNRRNLTDWELLQCLQKLDFRKKVGRPEKSSSAPQGNTSKLIAATLGISSKKVEKLRAISDYGTDEIKNALCRGEYSINGAYEAVMAPRRKQPKSLPDADAEIIHAVMADIHARLNEGQIRKLVKALQIELAIN